MYNTSSATVLLPFLLLHLQCLLGIYWSNSGLDFGYHVVMGLMKNSLLANRHVYADNFFISAHLASDLLQADTYLCGTTRASRREFPNALAETHLFSGESVKWTSYDGVMLMKWHDKRDVYMISTNDAGGDIVRQTRRNHQDVNLHVLTCVVRYNKSMGGVDHLDQMPVILRCRPVWQEMVEVPVLGPPRHRHHQRLHTVEAVQLSTAPQ